MERSHTFALAKVMYRRYIDYGNIINKIKNNRLKIFNSQLSGFMRSLHFVSLCSTSVEMTYWEFFFAKYYDVKYFICYNFLK